MTRASGWADRVVERIGASRRSGSRALLVGAAAAALADSFRRIGFDVQHVDTPGELEEGTQDIAVVAGALEREPWDRWMLQRLHRALVDDGTLVLLAANFGALTSPSDLAFLFSRARSESWRRTRRALGRPPARERFRGRRYRASRLIPMLEHLGFEVTVHAMLGHGWLAPLSRAAPRAVERGARDHLVIARRRPSLFGLDPRRPWPDAETHRLRFEAAHHGYIEDRVRWLERHPDFRPATIEALLPGAYRGTCALVLAPHPDDELIGCGGTLARLIAHDVAVTVVHATDGSEAASLWHAPMQERRTIRLEEAARVGKTMGFGTLVFWREDNGAFREREERVQELTAMLARLRPSLVFTPFITDVHPDHRVLSRMLARAIRAVGAGLEDTRVLGYQVWSLVPPNLYCDVTEMAGLQERALLQYETAMKVDDYVHFCQDRNYHDAVAVAGTRGFVETYFAIPARRYPDVIATGGGRDA